MVKHHHFPILPFGLISLILLMPFGFLRAQDQNSSVLPVRGLSIAVPDSKNLDRFLKFIREDLSEFGVNTLVLRVNYAYQFATYPGLAEKGALTKKEAKRIVSACKDAGIRIIPLLNLLGHQSWHENLNPLLTHYPEFDETPQIKMPEVYQWPNPDRLYCKSYCPLHPEIHKVIFSLIDELMEVFEADAFHAGMDEVFYIADPECPRCGGRDPAELFAGEVHTIRDHLRLKGKELWIWGDRLLDGKITGLGMWEASMNNTARAIDMIPKDVVICDWHYEQPVPTAPYFAVKGFSVIACPYRKSEVALAQLNDMMAFRANATEEMKSRFLGMMQTVWASAADFLDAWYGTKKVNESLREQADCLKALFSQYRKLARQEQLTHRVISGKNVKQ